jgi:eukaryotic translation initiation factor 2C
MVYERIVAYEQAAHNFPKRILFYRDGVSTGQFAKVRDEELPLIKAVFRQRYPIAKGRETTPLPRVTVVVTVKRHHTRFYPAKAPKHLNGNCVPGTLVDRVVTSPPHYFDFFLQSHHGLKGTTIPTHYVVIANEIGLGDRELQELTWKMCYTYVRAKLGVSYAPPVYYSDRFCDRGRAYMRDFYSPDPDSAHT